MPQSFPSNTVTQKVADIRLAGKIRGSKNGSSSRERLYAFGE